MGSEALDHDDAVHSVCWRAFYRQDDCYSRTASIVVVAATTTLPLLLSWPFTQAVTGGRAPLSGFKADLQTAAHGTTPPPSHIRTPLGKATRSMCLMDRSSGTLSMY